MQKPTDVLEFLKFKLRDQDREIKLDAVQAFKDELYKFNHSLYFNKPEAKYEVQSRLVAHAIHEFSLLPKAENELDQQYQDQLQSNALDLVFVFSRQGHSGGTAADLLDLFNRLMARNPLTPLTNNPAEWEDMSAQTGYPFWQNKRNYSAFSKDGGLTYWIAEGDKMDMITAEPYNDAVQTKED
jgi:hypothetical protein